MSRIQLLRLSAFLPLVTPIVLTTIVLALDSSGLRTPVWLGAAAAMIFSSILMFGVPYAVVAGTVFLALRHQPWGTHVKATLAAPWLMAVAAVAFAFVPDPSPISWADATLGGAVIAFFCLAVGYLYIAIALTFIHVLALAGRVAPEQP